MGANNIRTKEENDYRAQLNELISQMDSADASGVLPVDYPPFMKAKRKLEKLYEALQKVERSRV